MCLWVENIIRKVANDNIICYKVCKRGTDENYISLFRGYEYKLLEKYNNNIPLNNDDYFYSLFIDRSGLNFLCYGNALGPDLFHSYKKEFYLESMGSEVVLKCAIPKGAYYWEDKDYYASSQIIILAEL